MNQRWKFGHRNTNQKGHHAMTYQPKTTREQERKVTLTNYVPDDIEDRSRMVSKGWSNVPERSV